MNVGDILFWYTRVILNFHRGIVENFLYSLFSGEPNLKTKGRGNEQAALATMLFF